ncbi:MAG: NifB/NifX family molybdenum-iron cluster-binding protein [Pseudomonadota bacterium]
MSFSDLKRGTDEFRILSSQYIPEGQLMKIAVTSQNRKTITEHAGRCRKFWIFEVENNAITNKKLLELPKEQSFHDSSPHEPHPLDVVDVLIAGGMGEGLMRRLGRKGIKGVVTQEVEPEKAVLLYVEGSLKIAQSHQHSHGRHV